MAKKKFLMKYVCNTKNLQETNMKVIRYLILDTEVCEVSLVKWPAKNFIDLLYKILTSKDAKESRYEKILWKTFYEKFTTMTEVSKDIFVKFLKNQKLRHLYASFRYGLHGYYGETPGTIDNT